MIRSRLRECGACKQPVTEAQVGRTVGEAIVELEPQALSEGERRVQAAHRQAVARARRLQDAEGERRSLERHQRHAHQAHVRVPGRPSHRLRFGRPDRLSHANRGHRRRLCGPNPALHPTAADGIMSGPRSAKWNRATIGRRSRSCSANTEGHWSWTGGGPELRSRHRPRSDRARYDPATDATEIVWRNVGRVRDIAQLPSGKLLIAVDAGTPKSSDRGRIVELSPR